MKILEEYKREIKAAKTRAELQKISYKAFLADDEALSGKRTLYNKVVSLCVKREEELGLL